MCGGEQLATVVVLVVASRAAGGLWHLGVVLAAGEVTGSQTGRAFTAKGPHFFKIIHSGIVQDQKLRIPTKFMKKHGKDLSNLAFLKVPSGEEWQVKLINSNGKVWIQDGWQKFIKHYSIGLGHFLVFRYDGNSHFHVLIFDMSASEIEYPICATRGRQTSLNEECQIPEIEVIEIDDSVENLDDFPTREKEQIEKDASVRILDDFQTCRTTIKATPSSEMMINNLTCKTQNTINRETLFLDLQSRGIQMNGLKLENSNAAGDSRYFTRPIKKECGRGMDSTQKRKLVMANEKVRALQRANAFKSENPFFMVFMQPSYVSTNFVLNIPLSFAEKYFTDKQNIVLRVSDGRTSSVKCHLGSCNAKFCRGWCSFAQDNNLKVGDVCVFELIKEIEPSLKVIIFRSVEEAKCCLPLD
ncbi:hypothetical protein F0562_003866 [Nyssa sinensis]|uniref:TF-B3 domain-containing protein n=1 Tax=Nyssa sinensis TaxID=561372 RepID=A0A5J5BZF2_9ASTE|nr:hypothetical protein F0562_003866 [Nyssa sinensis]